MAIYELVPRYKIGPLELRRKLGQEIKPQGSATVHSQQEQHMYEGLQASHRDKNGFPVYDKKVDIPWWQSSGIGIVVVNPDLVQTIYAADDSIYGYIQTNGEKLAKQEINKHPLVGKKIRWVESTPASPQV